MVQEQVSVPEVDPTSPTPLLPTTEEKEGKEFTSSITSSTEPDLRLPIGVWTEGKVDVVEVKNDEGPGYMQGSNLDVDETQLGSGVPSGYEKRPVFVELAPDEPAEGYRG